MEGVYLYKKIIEPPPEFSHLRDVDVLEKSPVQESAEACAGFASPET